LELVRTRLAWPLIAAALLGACDKSESGERAREAGSTIDTFPRLMVASNPGWQLLTIDSLGFSLRTPIKLPLDIRGASSECVRWNRQPLLYADGNDTFIPVYFSTGSLGEALQSVNIGYHNTEGHYVSYGRMGATSRLETFRGLRSLIFSGTRMVGVPLSEEGGMATDEVSSVTAVLRRPDGCWVIFTFDDYAEDISPGILWHILETVRFAGEDLERVLPGQHFVGPFDFGERLRKVVTDSAGTICLLDPPAGLHAGVPVTVLREWGGEEAHEMVVPDAAPQCAHPDALAIRPHFTEYAPLHTAEGIGLIAPAGISFQVDSLVLDLDGNGHPERLDACVAGDSTEYRIVERLPRQDMVRFRTRSAERMGYDNCRN
jgi:hypothetical protein